MISYGDIVPGQLYVWLGHPVQILEYTRSVPPTPDRLSVTSPMLDYGDIFAALEVIQIEERDHLFDLKILTTKGDLGYIFRWKVEGIPARIILSQNDVL
jgi:hypothetical protein